MSNVVYDAVEACYCCAHRIVQSRWFIFGIKRVCSIYNKVEILPFGKCNNYIADDNTLHNAKAACKCAQQLIDADFNGVQ